ncbi:unnamed protein product, partial [Polarella glacialis]
IACCELGTGALAASPQTAIQSHFPNFAWREPPRWSWGTARWAKEWRASWQP